MNSSTPLIPLAQRRDLMPKRKRRRLVRQERKQNHFAYDTKLMRYWNISRLFGYHGGTLVTIEFDESEEYMPESCVHRWVLHENNSIICILCQKVRVMGEEEIDRVKQAERAGLIFLKWPEKPPVQAGRKKKGSTAAPRPRHQITIGPPIPFPPRKGSGRPALGKPIVHSTTTVSTPSGHVGVVVQSQEAVPEGFVSVKDAAEKLHLEPKKLRKLARDGRFKSCKVGGNVFIQLPKDAG